MARSDAIEVEGDVDVVGTRLPEDMAEGARERARKARIGNLLIILERFRADIERDISHQLQAMTPDLAEAHAILVLDDDTSSFVVSVEIKEGDGTVGHANAREWLKSLPEAVRQVIATCIDGHATRTGTWEPRITARLRSRDSGGESAVAQEHLSVRYRIGFWLAMAIVAGAAIAAIVRG